MRRLTAEDKERYATHAAPEAIAAELASIRAEKVQVDNRISWLETLHARRCQQVANGTWPATEKGG